MAKIIGKSGAWKYILNQMDSLGFSVESISEISTILADEKSRLAAEEKKKERLLEQERENFSKKLEILEENYQKAVLKAKQKITQNAEVISQEIKQLEEPVPFFKKIKQGIRLYQERKKLKKLRKKSEAFFRDLKQKKSEKEKRLKTAHEKRNFDIQDRVGKIEYNIEMLRYILSSPEHAGAIAELKLAKYLNSLPKNYTIIHDVKLIANNSIRFDGAWRKSAQIDTLVISPAGIFVIEVKNWSREFIASNDYHDPYDQVKWASYLCYKQTRVKTRSIIAHTGNIPAKPKDSYAKTLLINDVNGYILYFKDREISDTVIDKTTKFLSGEGYLF